MLFGGHTGWWDHLMSMTWSPLVLPGGSTLYGGHFFKYLGELLEDFVVLDFDLYGE